VSGFANTVTDGPLLLAAGAAAVVGVLGFLSPCVLPLVPGYLSYVTGVSGTEPARPRRVMAGAGLFVLGFTAVFVASGALLGALGTAITTHRVVLERIGGAVTIVMGLALLGVLPILGRELRFQWRPRAGLAGAPLLGAGFGLAWTPCLTPTVGAVYTLAVTQSTAGRGALLALAYCAGLGVPFLLAAAGVGWLSAALGFIRRHNRVISLLGGAILIVMGVLLATGTWDHWMNDLRATVGPATGVGARL
jgi:cytochrome c-type biogenesis protein